MTHRCGFVAVVGAPNAGKSTIVNALVGQKVAIVSPKAQTTRTRLMGVAIEGQTQLLLVDTPGIFEPTRRFDRAMVAAAWGGSSARAATLMRSGIVRFNLKPAVRHSRPMNGALMTPSRKSNGRHRIRTCDLCNVSAAL